MVEPGINFQNIRPLDSFRGEKIPVRKPFRVYDNFSSSDQNPDKNRNNSHNDRSDESWSVIGNGKTNQWKKNGHDDQKIGW